MKKRILSILFTTIFIVSLTGCGKSNTTSTKEDANALTETTTETEASTLVNEDTPAETESSSESTDIYADFLNTLPENSYYSEIAVGTKDPVLFVTDSVYDNMDGNHSVSIHADAYYPVNGTIETVGVFDSSDTAYPLCIANDGIYVGGNHSAQKYIYHEDTNSFEVTEGVCVTYEEGTGNETYTAIHKGEEEPSTEKEFLDFYDYTKDCYYINFKSLNLLDPLPLMLTSEAGDEMPDGTYHVDFNTKEPFSKKGEDSYLQMEFYEYDRYDAEAVKNLRKNQSIRYGGEIVKVEDMYTVHDDNGTLITVSINGGVEEGGIFLLYDKEDKSFRGSMMDDCYDLYSIGSGTLKVSKDITLADHTLMENPTDVLPDDKIVHYDDLEKAITQKEYGSNNTYAIIKNNEVIRIEVKWTP